MFVSVCGICFLLKLCMFLLFFLFSAMTAATEVILYMIQSSCTINLQSDWIYYHTMLCKPVHSSAPFPLIFSSIFKRPRLLVIRHQVTDTVSLFLFDGTLIFKSLP